jgi:hypothetical protein
VSELVVQGVPIPFGRGNGALGDFMTPDWEDVFRFYPTWVEQVRAAGKEPWEIQAYMLEICKVLEKGKARPERDRDDWMRRLLEHFGIGQFSEWITRYENVR